MSVDPTARQRNDVKAMNIPNDNFSCISFNGTNQVASNLLYASAWDNTVSCYEITQTELAHRGSIRHDTPVLSCCSIGADNVSVASGSCDGVLKLWNPTLGAADQGKQFGKLDGGCSAMRWLPELNCLVTTSWDRSVKLWDLRSSTPTGVQCLSDSVLTMDAVGTIAVAATADRNVSMIDLRAGQLKTYRSPLEFQVRTVSISSDSKCYALGCVEGRVAIEAIDEVVRRVPPEFTKDPKEALSFIFKCHRDTAVKKEIYPVNSVHFHPRETHAFLTAGSDGSISIWDKSKKNRVTSFDMLKGQSPIIDAIFSPDGTLMAYAAGYDWSRGVEQNIPSIPRHLLVHRLDRNELVKN